MKNTQNTASGIFAFLIFLLSFSSLQASNTDTTKNNSPGFQLFIEGSSYFFDAEYFNPYIEGYTLPGFFFSPEIQFSGSKDFSASAGIFLQAYSSEEHFNSAIPYLKISWEINPVNILYIGRIENRNLHGLPEFFYFKDTYLRKPFESGFELITKNNNLTSDLWIDWENFIDYGDSDQEKIWFGYSAGIHPLIFQNHKTLSFPIYISAYHRGGQVNNSQQKVSTIYNGMAGINLSIPGIEFAKLSIQHAFFTDPTKDSKYKYSLGYGDYLGVKFEKKKISTELGIWKARHFISPKGNPIFLSLSEKDSGLFRPDINLLYLNFRYHYNLKQSNDFQFFSSFYFDLYRMKIDYNLGISLNIQTLLK